MNDISQADGTAWMGFYCLYMLKMAVELAQEDLIYEDIASKFFEHFSECQIPFHVIPLTKYFSEHSTCHEYSGRFRYQSTALWIMLHYLIKLISHQKNSLWIHQMIRVLLQLFCEWICASTNWWTGLWDHESNFYYDQLKHFGSVIPLRIRSIVVPNHQNFFYILTCLTGHSPLLCSW